MQIEVFSDLICPWCYIGKRRLDAVVSSRGRELQVIWRAYQLYPHLPAGGIDRRQMLEARYGADADPSRVPERLRAEAAAEGIELNYADMQRVPNTFAGHRLMVLAGRLDDESGNENGAQHRLAEALFEAHFRRGLDLGDIDVLAQAAAASGLPETDARTYLNGEDGADEVRAELERASTLDISGVPAFLLAGRFVLPGAQPADVMAQFIDRAQARFGDAAT